MNQTKIIMLYYIQFQPILIQYVYQNYHNFEIFVIFSKKLLHLQSIYYNIHNINYLYLINLTTVNDIKLSQKSQTKTAQTSQIECKIVQTQCRRVRHTQNIVYNAVIDIATSAKFPIIKRII